MNKDLKSLLELISFLEINEGDHLLELTDGHYLMAPMLKSSHVSLNYTIDLCLLNDRIFHSPSTSYYERLFFIKTLEELEITSSFSNSLATHFCTFFSL